MTEQRNKQLIEFLKIIEKLKMIERQVFLSNKRQENDAEHSWHLAMCVLLFKHELKDFDAFKMLKMALTHDLVEIYAGDTFLFDKKNTKTKVEREIKAAEKLFGKLPPDLEKEFFEVWQEYENCSSKEAEIIKAFDKILPIIQNILSDGKAWRQHHISYQDIDDYKRSLMTEKLTLDVYEELMQELKKKKILKD